MVAVLERNAIFKVSTQRFALSATHINKVQPLHVRRAPRLSSALRGKLSFSSLFPVNSHSNTAGSDCFITFDYCKDAGIPIPSSCNAVRQVHHPTASKILQRSRAELRAHQSLHASTWRWFGYGTTPNNTRNSLVLIVYKLSSTAPKPLMPSSPHSSSSSTPP